jgi:hypothetical protein
MLGFCSGGLVVLVIKTIPVNSGWSTITNFLSVSAVLIAMWVIPLLTGDWFLMISALAFVAMLELINWENGKRDIHN